MKFKKYFESLPKIQKTEVYLIILMSYSLIFIFYEDILTMIRTDSNHEKVIIKNEKTTQSNLNSMNHIELLQYIIKLNNKFDITLLDTQILKESIELKFEGNFHNIVNTLKEFQNKFIIKKFEIQKKNDVLSVNVVLDTKYLFNDKSNQVIYNKLYNPFNKKEKKKIKVHKDIKVTAIIDKEVLINGKWYKKNDTVYIYNIINISKGHIIIFNNLTKITTIKEVDYE